MDFACDPTPFSYLTDKQVDLLLKPIHPNRVLQLKGLSYVEGFDIRAELNRIFGFGRWEQEILDQSLICETEVKTNAGKPAWYVIYRSRLRLTVKTPDGYYLARYEGSHVGESTHPVRGEAHGNALVNSETYALRRCAINLGDQFGLSLYNKGSLDAIVRWTLVHPEGAEKPAADTSDVPVVSAEEPEFRAAEAISEPSKPVSARGRTAQEKPLTPGGIAGKIAAAKTVEELRAAWKDAGILGVLNDKHGNLTIQEHLYARLDQLSPAKSSGAGAENAGKDPGKGHGDQ